MGISLSDQLLNSIEIRQSIYNSLIFYLSRWTLNVHTHDDPLE